MKCAVFERQQGQHAQALETLTTALQKYPSFDKLHMIKAQIYEDLGQIADARATYAKALKACPKSITLWTLASRLEERDNKAIKARSLLEKARLVNPKEDILWAEAVGVEERSSGATQAKVVLARGASQLLLCPTGRLTSIAQAYKSVRHRDCFGHSIFGSSPVQREKLVRLTRSKSPSRTRLSFALLHGFSGPKARSKRPDNGFNVRSRLIGTSVRRGPGG